MARVRIRETELNVIDQGRGAAVLLVHGFPLSHRMWREQIEALSGGFRVIAPDLRGFGDSAPLSPGETELTMERLADDLAELLDALELPGPIAFCGLSMGGYVAWQFAARHSHRLGSLILCDTRAAADTPPAREARRALAQQVLDNGPEVAATAMLTRLVAEHTPDKQPDLVERVRQMITGTRRETIAAALLGMARRPDSTELLGRLKVPSLVIVGEYDALSPPDEMRDIAGRIRGARFVEVPGAGHLAPLENPAVVNEAITGFLAELDGRG